jgi:hypothetical protein
MHQSQVPQTQQDIDKQIVIEALKQVLRKKQLTRREARIEEHEPSFWNEVALEAFGKQPLSSVDPLWDRMLQPGLRYLHDLD